MQHATTCMSAYHIPSLSQPSTNDSMPRISSAFARHSASGGHERGVSINAPLSRSCTLDQLELKHRSRPTFPQSEMECNETLAECPSTTSDEDRPWRNADIISRGHTDKPLPSGLLGQNEEVTAYFISRRDATNTAPTKYSFSMQSPHSCIGCRHVVVTDALLRSKDRISLSQDLLTAIHAAQQGCAFFAWLLDFLCDPAEDLLENDLFFGMRYADVDFYLITDPNVDSVVPELNVVADFIKPSGSFATAGFLTSCSIGFWTDEGTCCNAEDLGDHVIHMLTLVLTLRREPCCTLCSG